jgi:predicted DCC family thiol-disulfide oxidoreductase YuxK
MSARYLEREADAAADRARPATLLYDEDCGLCRATAAWLGHRVSPIVLRLMPLSEAARDPFVSPRVAGRDLKAMLHLVHADGEVATGARAVLSAARLAPRWRLVAAAFDHRLGHVLLEPIYRQIARHRRQVGRLLGLPPSCPVPLPAERPGAIHRGDTTLLS